jgi:hypothetical protein
MRQPHGSIAVLGIRLPLPGSPGLQIGTSAEGTARTGQHRNALVGRGVELLEHLNKGLTRGWVDGVADLRSLNRHDGNGAMYAIAD